MIFKIAENFYFADFKSSTCSVKKIKNPYPFASCVKGEYLHTYLHKIIYANEMLM